MKRFSIFLITVAIIAGMVGCGGVVEYDLTITSTAGGSVATPGEDTYTCDEGEMVNLVAEPDEGYRFKNWTGDVESIDDVNAASTTITINGDYSVTAMFEEDAVVTFLDLNLETAIRQAIGKPERPIYTRDMEQLTQLDAGCSGIYELTGLEYATHLTRLNLRDNQVSDISPLANLVNLTELFIWHNEISDLSPLASLTNLKELDVTINSMSDITLLTNLTDLTTLGLRIKQTSDAELPSLTELTNLRELEIEDNQISDISALANLTELTGLWLWNNQISDISPVANLTNLRGLEIGNNQVSDISPLVDNEGLSERDEVYLTENPLNSNSINIYIPQLEARGVTVYY